MGRPSFTLLILLPPAFLLLLFATKQSGKRDEQLVFVGNDHLPNITNNSPILVYNKVIQPHPNHLSIKPGE